METLQARPDTCWQASPYIPIACMPVAVPKLREVRVVDSNENETWAPKHQPRVCR